MSAPDAHPVILVADDTEDMRILLEAAFAGSRFSILGPATDGQHALELWRTHSSQITAIVLDHRMPGLEGLDVARLILAEHPGIPIVLFSAELGRELQAEAEALGIGVLHKDEVLRLPDHPAFANL